MKFSVQLGCSAPRLPPRSKSYKIPIMNNQVISKINIVEIERCCAALFDSIKQATIYYHHNSDINQKNSRK